MRKLILAVIISFVLLYVAVPVACAQVTPPKASVAPKIVQPQRPEQPLGRVMLRYNVGYKDGKFLIPPTGKELTLGERLGVIFLVAKNYGIPYSVLGAICFEEGWDKFTGERCKHWYNNGSLVTSVSGALGAFQIWPPAHPEVDKKRLEVDFTYCVEQAARILVAKRGPKSSTDPLAWEESAKAYFGVGKPQTNAYWAAVLGFIKNPPIIDGQRAW